MERQNTINIALVGEVSSGKSTLLNSMFIKTFSEMKRIRTTMSVNIYAETNDKLKVVDADQIIKANTSYETSMKDKKVDELKEFTYFVSPSIDFGDKISKTGYNLNVIDIPGLNDGVANNVIKSWLDKNFYMLDVVFFVINGDSAFNSESERNLLKYIVDNMSKNPNVILFNLINKYDSPDDEELKELKTQADKVIKEVTDDKKLISVTLPISAEKAYLYRYLEHNKTLSGLSTKHTKLIAKEELGNKANKYDEGQLLQKILETINDSKKVKDGSFYGYKLTGYDELIKQFNTNVVNNITDIYFSKVLRQVRKTDICGNDFNEIFDKYRKIIGLKTYKDDHLESLITSELAKLKRSNIISESDKVIAFFRILNKNANIIKTFCDADKLRISATELMNYIIEVIYKTQTDQKTLVSTLHAWIIIASDFFLIDEKFVSIELNKIYKSSNISMFALNTKDYFSGFTTLIEKLTKTDIVPLIQNFLIFVLAGALYRYNNNIGDGKNAYNCIKLLFEHYSDLSDSCSLSELLPIFSLKLKVLDITNYDVDFLMQIPHDFKTIAEYIKSIDPGFITLINKANMANLNIPVVRAGHSRQNSRSVNTVK